jgi:hypothetical protein
MLKFLTILSLLICISALNCLALNATTKFLLLNGKETVQDSLVISGTITKREEIWDRRTNPMMGRPDFLKEIIFHIQILSVISGNVPEGSGIITASVKDQKMLIKSKIIREGKSGIFTLQGNEIPFILINFDTLPGKTNVAVTNKVSKETKIKDVEKENKQEDNSLSAFEKKSGREMTASRLLQEKAVQAVVRKYKMKNAKFISLTSFSGPAPPEGGYIFWGVSGQIKGKWYVWQPGTNGKLREGKELDDPHRYQKCNSPQTKIMTPSGTVPISSLKIGDTVISGNNIAVRILKVSKVKADNHRVCRTTFDDGTILEISPGHPLADGRLFETLQPGDAVNGRRVLKNEFIPYQYEYTWDILPDSPSGTYFASGIEIASTMK